MRDNLIYKIHYSGDYEDFITLSAKTMEELKKKAEKEIKSRGWKEKDCWSECIQDETPHTETTILS